MPTKSGHRTPPSAGRRARHGFDKNRPASVSSVIAGSLSIPGIETKLREYGVKKIWAEAVGGAIAGQSRPLRLIGKTLYCAVSSSAWMTELNYQKGAIIEKINERLGEAFIAEIVFKYGGVAYKEGKKEAKAPLKAREVSAEERNFIEKTVRPVKDEALKTLIKRVMEKSKS